MQDQDPTNDAFNCYFAFAKCAWKGHDVPLLLAKVSHFVPANKSMSVLSSVPKSKLPEMEHDDLVDSVIQLWARADRAGGDLKDCGPTHILPALNTVRSCGCSKKTVAFETSTLRILDHFSYNQAHTPSSHISSNTLFKRQDVRTRVARDRPSDNNKQQQPVIHTSADITVPHD